VSDCDRLRDMGGVEIVSPSVSERHSRRIHAGLLIHKRLDALVGEWEMRAVIGGTHYRERDFYMLYADARGVFRVYRMSLSDGVWKIGRDAPGFFQRFTGTFSADGNTITARVGKESSHRAGLAGVAVIQQRAGGRHPGGWPMREPGSSSTTSSSGTTPTSLPRPVPPHLCGRSLSRSGSVSPDDP
jgi:hypothetical protein